MKKYSTLQIVSHQFLQAQLKKLLQELYLVQYPLLDALVASVLESPYIHQKESYSPLLNQIGSCIQQSAWSETVILTKLC